MSRVKLSGVPKNVRLAKLLAVICKILRISTSDFFAHVPPIKGPVKDVLLSFINPADAHQAREKLDNFVYIYGNETYVFTATLEADQRKHQPRQDRYKKNARHTARQSYQPASYNYAHEDTRHYRDGPSRDRSRSPHYSDEASRLDMQIEILRKQRMILEEERKLLEEQQRLDDIKMKSLKNEKRSVSEKSFNEDYNCDETSQDEVLPIMNKKFERKILSYHKASGVLLGKMYGLVEKYSTKEMRKSFAIRVRAALKQRLATALEGQPFYQTYKIIQLYRMKHPDTEDDDFVRELAEKIDVSGWPDDAVVGAQEGNDGNAGETGNDERNATEGLNAIHTDPLPIKVSAKKMKNVYNQATGILVGKLDVHLDKHSTPEIRRKLVTMLRAALRKRLEAVAANTTVFQINRLIKCYREKHLVSDDEDFVKSILKQMEESGAITSKTDDGNASEVVESGQGDVIDKNAPANEGLDVSDATDKKSNETNENKTLQNVNETKNTNDSGFVEEVRASTEGKSTSTKGESIEEGTKNVGDDELQIAVTEATTESGSDQPAIVNIEVNNSEIAKDTNEAEKNDIEANVQKNLNISTTENNGTTDQPVINTEEIDFQSDIMNRDLVQNETNNTYIDEINRGIKRKTDEIEEKGMKVAKNANQVTSDDTNEVILVNAD